ncbi:unnamed protein product, partial [marine sediment metagenome]
HVCKQCTHSYLNNVFTLTILNDYNVRTLTILNVYIVHTLYRILKPIANYIIKK